jgi:hypothetical protein
MATTEHTINDSIANALRGTRHGWNDHLVVRSENTGTLTGRNKRPDIIVAEPSVSPVIIETEVLPAITVEAEAKDRLGETLRENGRMILSSVAVRSPAHFRNLAGGSLATEISVTEELEFALYTGDSPTNNTRWPKIG